MYYRLTDLFTSISISSQLIKKSDPDSEDVTYGSLVIGLIVIPYGAASNYKDHYELGFHLPPLAADFAPRLEDKE
jgi:hypothetical protein